MLHCIVTLQIIIIISGWKAVHSFYTLPARLIHYLPRDEVGAEEAHEQVLLQVPVRVLVGVGAGLRPGRLLGHGGAVGGREGRGEED